MNKESKLYKLVTNKTLWEIFRFLVVGGIATICDYLAAGTFKYIVDGNNFNSFLDALINKSNYVWITIVSITIGFLVGLIVNYILSLIFVFNNKGNSKSTKGFILFTVLSVIGLGMTYGGVLLMTNVFGWLEIIARVIMTIIVMCYNYVSKRLIIFKSEESVGV